MPALCQSDVSNRYIAKICARARPRNSSFTRRFPDPPRTPANEPIRGSERCGFRRTLSGMGVRRSVVDYGLARRATLASVLAGRTTVADVCDAHPYLLRAAKFHGEPTDTACPICRRSKLTHVTYVYGDELGQYAGRVKQGPELTEMASEYGEFRVYVVEVCQSCAWNHLASSYVLGTGEPRARRSRRARASE
jgi:Family of unknown function (DUF5318)